MSIIRNDTHVTQYVNYRDGSKYRKVLYISPPLPCTNFNQKCGVGLDKVPDPMHKEYIPFDASFTKELIFFNEHN